MKRLIACLVFSVLLSSCDLFGPDEGGNVAVRFQVAPPGGSASSVPLDLMASSAAADALLITGRNGTLSLTRIALIVDKLELEGHGAACEDLEPDHEERGDNEEDDDEGEDHGRECEFKMDDFLLELPVDGTELTVADDLIPVGIYDQLEFRIDNAKHHLDHDADRVISMLEAELRSRFPDWPHEASVLIEGSFLPTGGGAARPFRAFMDTELKVEIDLVPPLEVTESGRNRVVTIQLQPDLWFRRIDGNVVDLSAFDFGRTGWVVRLDVPFARAFRRSHDDH
jgi:hypothetical protein